MPGQSAFGKHSRFTIDLVNVESCDIGSNSTSCRMIT